MRISRSGTTLEGAIAVCSVAQMPPVIVDQAGFIPSGISFFRSSKPSINARNRHEFRIFG